MLLRVLENENNSRSKEHGLLSSVPFWFSLAWRRPTLLSSHQLSWFYVTFFFEPHKCRTKRKLMRCDACGQFRNTGRDEMCNFYVMYWTEAAQGLLRVKTCFSAGPPYYYWDANSQPLNNIPDDASDLWIGKKTNRIFKWKREPSEVFGRLIIYPHSNTTRGKF